jgi:hypothetical protein
MNRYIAHIETNHPNYEQFVELSAKELANAQNESLEYVYILNDIVFFSLPLLKVFRITIYEKTLEFTEKGIATYQSVSQRISEKQGFYEHYTDIVHFANSHFYKVVY